jgi:hypothetical protein
MLQKITKTAKAGVILLFCIILSSKNYAQTTVQADPALSSFNILSTSNSPVDANGLTNNTFYYLDLIFQNNYFNPIPDHTAYIVIGLGLNMILDPMYNLATAPYSQYINWSYLPPSGGQQAKIAGIIHTALPLLFSGTAEFKVKTITPGTQIITGNFLVNNQNPLFFLQDVQANNVANISYTVSSAGPLPVTLTKFSAAKKDCIINAIWSVENELNFSHYELQASSDGITYTTINTVTANNIKNYNSAFDISTQTAQLRGGATIFLRLKMVDRDATFKYSDIVPVNSSCDVKSSFVIYGYPNPVSTETAITIAARGGLFNGNYNISIVDMSGRVLVIRNMDLNNVQSFRFDFGTMLTNGKYMIMVQKLGGEQKGIIQIEKL